MRFVGRHRKYTWILPGRSLVTSKGYRLSVNLFVIYRINKRRFRRHLRENNCVLFRFRRWGSIQNAVRARGVVGREMRLKKLGEVVMQSFLARFAKDESGATAIEYGLIAALIGTAIVVGARAVGNNLGTLFNNIAGDL